MQNIYSTKINITSYGIIFGKPNIFDSMQLTNKCDIDAECDNTKKNIVLTFDVSNMDDVPKKIRDKYNGTSKILQNELIIENEKNNSIYTNIVENIYTNVYDIFLQSSHISNNLTIDIYINCVRGRHRSVAVVELIAAYIKQSSIVTLFDKNAIVNIMHRDLHKKNKRDHFVKNVRNKQRDQKYNTNYD
jgi:hypothetical protein